MRTRPVAVKMMSGLPDEDVQQWMARTTRMEHAGKRGFAFYIHDMQERGIHQKTGHQSAVHYAVDRLR